MNLAKVTTVLLAIIVIILLGVIIKIGQVILVPLLVAVLLSFILSPAISFLEKLHVPRILSIVIAALLILAFFYLISLFLYTSVNSFINQYPKYQARFEEHLQDFAKDIYLKLHLSGNFFADIDWGSILRTSFLSITGNFVSILKDLGITIIFLVFLLLEKTFFKKKLNIAFDEKTSEKLSNVVLHINAQIGRYIAVKVFVSLLTGILVWISLLLIGMDFAIIWGVLAVLLNFIPSIGSFFLVIITILMGFIQFYPSWGRIVVVIIAMNAVQMVVGNFLDPKLSGEHLNLSPFIILVSLVFWGWLWGIIGLFLAVPLTVIIKIICENIPYLKPVSIFMESGRKYK